MEGHPKVVIGQRMFEQSPPGENTVELGFDPTALSFVADAIWVYDLGRDRMVWANPTALKFWRAESLEVFCARTFGANSDVTKGRLSDYADRFADGETIEAHWTLYPDNEPHTVRCRCTGVALNDGRMAMMVHVIGTGDDINERQGDADQAEALRDARDQLAQAEARFRTFAEVGSDWLWETDEDLRFVFYSSSVNEHYKRSMHEMLGMTRHELLETIGAERNDDETQAKWAKHAEDLAERRPFRDFEYAYRAGDGTIGYSAVSGDPVFSATGAFQGYRGVGRNVTGSVETERNARTLERERDIAVTANTLMNRFLATMSHELRTPLNAIIGFSEMISEEVFGVLGNETYHGYSKDILGSARHLLSIVDDLLGTSRLDLGEQALELERVSAKRLADEILAIAQGISLQQHIRLDSDVPEPGLELFIDRRSLKQVILNLVSNAIKFSEPSSAVSLRIAPNKDGVEIVVRDSGCGIPEDALESIFDPLRSIDPYRTGSGAGLGLWISKRFVTAHEGTLSIESIVGEGTTATVRLPLPELANQTSPPTSKTG